MPRNLADYREGQFDTGGTCEACERKATGEACYYFPKPDDLYVCRECAERIAGGLEREDVWTNAEESLPPPGVDVLVTDGKAHWIASQVCGGIWNSTPWRATPRVTHWMPLPPLPQPKPKSED